MEVVDPGGVRPRRRTPRKGTNDLLARARPRTVLAEADPVEVGEEGAAMTVQTSQGIPTSTMTTRALVQFMFRPRMGKSSV